MSDQDDNDLDSEFDSIFSDLDAEPGKDEVSSKATVPPPNTGINPVSTNCNNRAAAWSASWITAPV